jgi:hypothetical protein
MGILLVRFEVGKSVGFSDRGNTGNRQLKPYPRQGADAPGGERELEEASHSSSSTPRHKRNEVREIPALWQGFSKCFSTGFYRSPAKP